MNRLPRRTVLMAMMAAFVWTMTLRPVTALTAGGGTTPGAARAVQPAAAAPSGILRLHILANSNSGADQAAKLAVRDALLTVVERSLGPARTAAQADAEARKAAPRIEAAADAALARLGRSYGAHVVVGSAYFPDKRWGSLNLAAGVYPAVTVVLGRGSGQNWWCVVFPPLCLANPLDSVTRAEPVSAAEIMLGRGRAGRPGRAVGGFAAWLAHVVRSL